MTIEHLYYLMAAAVFVFAFCHGYNSGITS